MASLSGVLLLGMVGKVQAFGGLDLTYEYSFYPAPTRVSNLQCRIKALMWPAGEGSWLALSSSSNGGDIRSLTVREFDMGGIVTSGYRSDITAAYLQSLCSGTDPNTALTNVTNIVQVDPNASTFAAASYHGIRFRGVQGGQTYDWEIAFVGATNTQFVNTRTLAPTAPPPTVTGLSLNSDSTFGGTQITVTGTGFATGATVSFGGTAGTAVTVNSDTSLTVTTPARAAGTVNVTVTSNGASSANNGTADDITFAAPPTLALTVVPSDMNQTRGRPFTLVATPSVSVQNTVGRLFLRVNAPIESAITAASGAGWTCTIEPTRAVCFSDASIPAGGTGNPVTVTAEIPTTQNTINGTFGGAFLGGAARFPIAATTQRVTFNAPVATTLATASLNLIANLAMNPTTPATSTGGTTPLTWSISPALPAGLTLNSSTGEITGTPTAARAASNYTLTATDARGSADSEVVSIAVVSASALPTVTGISQPIGSTTGGETITITGTGFTGATRVTLTLQDLSNGGSRELVNFTDFRVNSDTSITLRTPLLTAPYDSYRSSNNRIRVTNAFGTSVPLLSSRFTFEQPVVNPNITIVVDGQVREGQLILVPVGRQFKYRLTPFASYAVNSSMTVRVDNLPSNYRLDGAQGTGWICSVSGTTSASCTYNTPLAAMTNANSVDFLVTPTSSELSASDVVFPVHVSGPGMTSYSLQRIHYPQSLWAVDAVDTTLVSPTLTLTQNQTMTPQRPVTAVAAQNFVRNWSVSPALPAGLTLNTTTGEITGTPTTVSPASDYTITATDFFFFTSSKTVSIAVRSPTPTVTSVSPNIATRAGGDTVIVRGTGFTGATSVRYVGSNGTLASFSPQFRVDSDTQITLTTREVSPSDVAPTHTPDYTVRVITPSGESADNGTADNLTLRLPVLSGTGTPENAVQTAGGRSFNYAVSISAAAGGGDTDGPVRLVMRNGAGFPTIAGASGTGWSCSAIPPSGTMSFGGTECITNTKIVAGASAPTLNLTLRGELGGVNQSPSVRVFARGTTDRSLTMTPVFFNYSVVTTRNNAALSFARGQAVTPVTPVTGEDGTGPLTWSISPALPAGLTMDPATGQITGTPTAARAATNHTITVTDARESSSSRIVSIAVIDPIPTITSLSADRGDVGGGGLVVIRGTNFNDVTSVMFGYIDAASYEVVNSTTINAIAPRFTLETVSVSVGTSAGRTADIGTGDDYRFMNPTLSFSAPSMAGGQTMGQPFSMIITPTSTGVDHTATTTVSFSGSGLDLVSATGTNWTCVVTPAFACSTTSRIQAGSSAAPITVTMQRTATTRPPTLSFSTLNVLDGAGNSTGFSFQINAAVATTSVANSLQWTVNTAITPATPVTATGGTGAIEWSVAPPLPAGLTLNRTSGEITGTPTAVRAASNHTLTATDTRGSFDSKVVSLAVVDPIPTITSITPGAGPMIGGTSVTINGTNLSGATQVRFGGTIVEAAEFTLISATQIRVTSPARTTAGAVNISVTTAAGTSADVAGDDFSYWPVPRITTTSVPNGTVGTEYASLMLQATSGTGMLNFSGSGLPPGLTLSDDGTLWGTPLEAGDFTLRATVTDANGQTGTADFAFNIMPLPPEISNLLLENGRTSVRSSLIGTPVTRIIEGRNLAAVTLVTFAGAPITFRPISDFRISVDMPATAAEGLNSLAVTSAAGSADIQYLYYRPIVITSVAPNVGPTTGYPVTITGRGFTGPYGNVNIQLIGFSNPSDPYAISQDPVQNVQFTVVDDTTITATIPASGLGRRSLFLERPIVPDLSESEWANSRVLLWDAPTITSMSPNFGNVAGGTQVTIQGTNFVEGMTVTFGGVAATGVEYVSRTELRATTPRASGGAGSVNVVVSSEAGSNADTDADNFAYVNALQISSGAIADGTVGTPYSQTLSGAGGSTPYGFSATGLPDGLALREATVAGTPTAAGSRDVVFTVTDANGQTNSTTRRVTIAQAQPTLALTAASATTVLGQSATFTARLTGGLAPSGEVEFFDGATSLGRAALTTGAASLSTTSLPAGNRSITARYLGDSNHLAATAAALDYSVTFPQPSITTSSLSGATVGSAYSQILAAAGGTAPYAFSVTNLPAGLTLSDNTISGIPTAEGNRDVTITLTDARGQRAERTLSLTVGAAPPPVITAVYDWWTFAFSPERKPYSALTSTEPRLIEGTNLAGATAVTLNGNALPFEQISGTRIRATLPPDGNPGLNQLAVTTPSGTSSSDYYYFSLPEITRISPNRGPADTGFDITITGSGFQEPFATIDSVQMGLGLVDFVVVNDTTITATLPAGAVGPKFIGINKSLSYGVATAATREAAVTFVARPAITSVTPRFGPPGGGTSVTLEGSNFSGATTVTFGGVPARDVRVVSDTQITATSPVGSGAIGIAVTSDGGKSADTAADDFTYLVPPSITTTSLPNGVVGTVYTQTLRADFGTAPYRFSASGLPDGLTLAANGTLSGTPTTAGAFTASVTLTDANSQIARAEIPLSVIPAAPAITAVRDSTGTFTANNSRLGSAQSRRIMGTNLGQASAVTLNGQALSFTQIDATQITVQMPATANEGGNSLVVTTPGGTANVAYYYHRDVEISAITPLYGPTTGFSVTLTGTGFTGAFADASTLTIGGQTAAFTVVNDTTITTAVPAGSAGPQTIEIRKNITPSAFTNASRTVWRQDLPAITSLSPNYGLVAGGTEITIRGANFDSQTRVSFFDKVVTLAEVPAPSVVVVSDSELRVTTPPRTGAGPVDVIATTAAGRSSTGTASSVFTYTLPLEINTASLPNGALGVDYVQNLQGAGGLGQRRFGGTGLPLGLSLSPDGTIWGVPQQAGNFTLSTTLTDAAGDSKTADLSLVIPKAQTALTLASSNASPSLGNPVTFTATLTNSFTVTGTVEFFDGSASMGRANLTSVAGSIVASLTTTTLRAGTRSITAVYSGDANNQTANAAALSQTVNVIELRITTPSLPGGTVGSQYLQNLTGTGGFGLYRFSAQGLPNGLNLSPDGTLWGTPLVAGDFTARVALTDDTAQTATANFAFTVLPLPPVIADVKDSTGRFTSMLSSMGTAGTRVLTGQNLDTVTAVTLAGTPLRFNLEPGPVLRVQMPATATEGFNTLQVTSPGGTASVEYVYFRPVAISSLTQNIGPTTGFAVTISGRGFTGAFGDVNTVELDGQSTPFNVVNDTTLTLNIPASTAGAKTIVLKKPIGLSQSVSADTFVVVQDAPTITNLTPNFGNVGGGTVVNIQGTNFDSDTTVSFGGQPATGVEFISETVLRATAPQGRAGRIDVTVSTMAGTSANTDADNFAYVEALQINSDALIGGTVGAAYSREISGAGGTAPYTFGAAGLPAGLSLTGATISGTPNAAGTSTVTLTLTDANDQIVTTKLDLTIAKAAPALALASSNASTILGDAVTLTATLTGGLAPGGTVEFFDGRTSLGTATLREGVASVTTNALPAGTRNITAVYAGDANHLGATAEAIPQTVGFPQPAITTAALDAGTVGRAYSLTLIGAGGTAPYTFGAAGLPAGLSLTGATISGTPNAAGTSTVTLTLTDANDQIVTTKLDLTIAKAAPALALASSNASTILGDAVTLTATLTGGLAPGGTVEFFDGRTSLGTATLREGVASVTTNALPAGTRNITAVYAGDANHLGATAEAIPQTVGFPQPAITTAALDAGTVGRAYSLTLIGAGGTAPYTFGAAGLPAGLRLTGATISGTPNAAGTSTVTLTLTDANDQIVTTKLDLTIAKAAPALALASSNASTIWAMRSPSPPR